MSGDLFILLAPTEESVELQQHRNILQKMYGGEPIIPVHFTCQRFMFFQRERAWDFFEMLKPALAGVQPIPVFANSIITLYSEFRQARVMKWRISVPLSLQLFSDVVEKTLSSSGGKSLYPPGWLSNLITALENIRMMDLDGSLDSIPVPTPLFTGDQVVLSRYKGHRQFEILDQFTLKPQ